MHILGVGEKRGFPSVESELRAVVRLHKVGRMLDMWLRLALRGLLENRHYHWELDGLYLLLRPVHRAKPMHGLLGRHQQESRRLEEIRGVRAISHICIHSTQH